MFLKLSDVVPDFMQGPTEREWQLFGDWLAVTLYQRTLPQPGKRR